MRKEKGAKEVPKNKVFIEDYEMYQDGLNVSTYKMGDLEQTDTLIPYPDVVAIFKEIIEDSEGTTGLANYYSTDECDEGPEYYVDLRKILEDLNNNVVLSIYKLYNLK